MRLFSKNKNKSEKLAVQLCHDGLYAVSVKINVGSAPSVDFACFYPGTLSESQLLVDRLAKETPARKKECSILLNFGDYQVLALEAMNVPDTELKGAVQWRIKEMIDFPVSDATLDVLKVPGDLSAGGRNQSLMAIVAPNTIIRKVQDIFRAARLQMTTIDIPEMAQRNLSAKLESAGRGLAMLSFDHIGGLLTVTFGGELYLSRRIDVSADQLSTSDVQDQTAVFERVSLELQRSLDHFERQHNYISNSKLVLAPFGAAAEELRAYLAANVYLPVELMDLSEILSFQMVPELRDPAQQARYCALLGAALRTELEAL